MTQELLGDYGGVSRVAGSAMLVAALALTVLFQRLQAALVPAEGSRWWASNGRDLINALSLAALGSTLWYLGFPGPSALVIAATVLLLLNLLESALLKGVRPKLNALLALAAGVALLAPVLLVPERVNALLNALANQLFS